jgi:hypothetical protein
MGKQDRQDRGVVSPEVLRSLLETVERHEQVIQMMVESNGMVRQSLKAAGAQFERLGEAINLLGDRMTQLGMENLDAMGHVQNILKIHHATIAELIERVSKLDGGDRPDLGDFGGRFSGLN